MDKKKDELIRDITNMIKETKAGRISWKVECQTTEYNQPEQKPVVEEDGCKWTVDECYVSYYCEYQGKEFLMITYEMIHTGAGKQKSTNLVFLPPLGIRYFDIHSLLPHAVEMDQMLSYEIHMLWLTLLEMHRTNPLLVSINADERVLTIEDE